MVRRIIVLLAVAVTVLGGTAAGVLAQPSLNKQDKRFLIQAHRSNLAEIKTAKLAEEKSGDQTVKDIARKLIDDHTAFDAKVRQAARKAGLPLPGSPNAKQTAVYDRLSKLSGTTFDRAWLVAQIAGHRNTLDNINTELQDGSSTEVKDLASSAKPVVRAHLEMLKKARGAGSPSPTETPTGGATSSGSPTG